MKHIFTSILLLGAGLQSFAQVTWSTPVTVSTGGTLGNLHPRVALSRNGNPMVLWGKTDTKAYFSRWSGSAFTAPVAVGNAGINVMAQSWAGPDIASYGDTVYVTMKRTPENINTNHMYMVHSYDGGMTFSDTVKIDNIDTSLSRFPIVTTTSAGNPLVAFMKFNAAFNDARYVVSRSSSYGMSFSSDVLASGTAGEVCNCCPASVISSGSNAIMLFRNNLSNIRDIWAGLSADGGMTFPMNIPVDTTNWMIMSCPSSGPDGFVIGDSIYTVFMSTSTGTALVHLSRASIGGMTARHSPVTGMFSGLSSQNYPRIANAGNAAAAVWKQNTTSGNSIVYSFTNNISSGLPAYAVVPTATGSGMMNADVAMVSGAIHIVWEDDNSGKVMYIKGTYTPPSTAVGDVISRERIDIYPNPASQEFSVSLDNIRHIAACSLVDHLGRAIELSPAVSNGKAAFSIAGLPKGGYYFVISDEAGEKFYSRLVIQ